MRSASWSVHGPPNVLENFVGFEEFGVVEESDAALKFRRFHDSNFGMKRLRNRPADNLCNFIDATAVQLPKSELSSLAMT